MRIAHGVKLLALVRWKFVRREVAPARVAKNERAIIQNKMLREKIFRRAKFFLEQTPQSFSAHLRARAIKSLHRPCGMHLHRRRNERENVQPVPHRRDFAERHAGLRHAERAGIHAEKHDALFSAAVFLKIEFVRRAGVVQRVADVRDRRLECQLVHRRRKFPRGGGEGRSFCGAAQITVPCGITAPLGMITMPSRMK